MLKMVITIAEAELMLRLLHADDRNNRDNDLEREPAFEELEAKLVAIVRGEMFAYDTFATADEAATALTRKGWLSTNAGWLNTRGKVATIVDKKNDAIGVERYFVIVVEDCDDQGRPIGPDV